MVLIKSLFLSPLNKPWILLAAYSESYRMDTDKGRHTHAFVDMENDDEEEDDDDDDNEDWQHLHSISLLQSRNHSNPSPMAVSSPVLLEHTAAPRKKGLVESMTTGP